MDRLQKKLSILSLQHTYLYNVNSPWVPSDKAEGRNGKVTLYPVQKTTASMFFSTVPSSNTTPVSTNAFKLGFRTIAPWRIWQGRTSLVKTSRSKILWKWWNDKHGNKTFASRYGLKQTSHQPFLDMDWTLSRVFLSNMKNAFSTHLPAVLSHELTLTFSRHFTCGWQDEGDWSKNKQWHKKMYDRKPRFMCQRERCRQKGVTCVWASGRTVCGHISGSVLSPLPSWSGSWGGAALGSWRVWRCLSCPEADHW